MHWKTKIIDRLPVGISGRLLSSSSTRDIVKNMLWLFFDKGYSMSVSFVIGVFVARYLGSVRFGLMNYAVSFVAMFRSLATFGLEEILTRELVDGKGQEGTILASAFVLRIAGSLLATVGIIVSIVVVKPDSLETQLLVCVASLINFCNLLMLLQRWFDSQLQAKYVVIASNSALTVFALIKIGLVYFAAPVVWFVAISAAQVFLAGIILTCIYFTRNIKLNHTWKVNKVWLKKLLSDAWPRIISGASVCISVNITIVIIGSLLSGHELGEFSLAYRLFAMLLFFSNIICQSLAHSLTKSYDNNPSDFSARLLHMYRMLFISNLLIGLAMLPIAIWGIPLIYGEEYLNSGMLLAGMLFTLPLYGLGAGRTWFIVVNRAFQYSMRLSVVTGLLNIVCVYWLVRVLGVWGAVVALFLNAFIQSFIQDLFFKKYRTQSITAWKSMLFCK